MMEVLTENIVPIVLLLAANAFFVAAEFALVKARGFRIEAMADDGRLGAAMTVRIQRHLEAYLAACQLGITMASLGLGWVGEPAVAVLLTPLLEPLNLTPAALHTTAFLVGFVIFSSLHIVVGEQVPKTFAIRKPEAMSLFIAWPLHAFYIAFYPLNWVLNRASNAILRMFRVKEAGHADVFTNAEIRGLIDISAEHGEMTVSKAEIIHNLFRFDERSVERIMIPRLECSLLRLDAPAEDNLRVMQETRHSRFPVVESGFDNLVGIVLVKDLMDAVLRGEKGPWGQLKAYCREPLVVPETLKIERLLETMRADRAHMACVVDEYGSFVGLVTMEDLLEEIVGEILDETDTETSEFYVRRYDDHWVAHGLAPLADVEREAGFSVEDSISANTLSGLIMNRLKRMPAKGDSIEEAGFRFTVLDMKGRRVESVRIEKPAADKAAH